MRERRRRIKKDERNGLVERMRKKEKETEWEREKEREIKDWEIYKKKGERE